MQVLVALAKEAGATVSRDALVESCWSGLVVGDDAVNRVIGRLRRLAAESGGAFRIETIPRVGFRLEPAPETATAPGAEQVTSRRRSWRRPAALGALAASIAALAFFAPGVSAFLRPAARIAVLEFLTGEPSQNDPFPQRLASRIRQVMSVNDLQIVARPDAAGFRGPDIPDVARRADVGYVLDGEVALEAGREIVVRVFYRSDLFGARANSS